MNKTVLAKILIIIIAICAATSIVCACGKGNDSSSSSSKTSTSRALHQHTFDKEVVKPKYLKAEATCESPAVYFKSCDCGERGTETFKYGEKLPHVYDKEAIEEKFLKEEATCTSKAVYFKSCKCGLKGTDTFEFGETLSHVFDEEVVEEKYLKEEATCVSKAVYFKSCQCGEKGSDTFEYGEKLSHVYDKEVAEEKYLKEEATCTSEAVYFKSCECGLKGTDTFKYGEKLPHVYDKEVVQEKYLKDKATCISPAVYFKSCQCGEKGSETFEYGKELGHTWDDGKTKDATCSEFGEILYTCEICLGTETQKLEKLPHTESLKTIDATESEVGAVIATCSVCGNNEIKEILPLISHSGNNSCSICNKTYVEIFGEYIKRVGSYSAGGYTLSRRQSLSSGYEVYTITYYPSSNKIDCRYSIYKNGSLYNDFYLYVNTSTPVLGTIAYNWKEIMYTTHAEWVETGYVVASSYSKSITYLPITSGYMQDFSYSSQIQLDAEMRSELNQLAVSAMKNVLNYVSLVMENYAENITLKNFGFSSNCGISIHTHSYDVNEYTLPKALCKEPVVISCVCNNCGLKKNLTLCVPHDYQIAITDPTCTEKGYTTHTCKDCGDVLVDDYVDELGHKTTEHFTYKKQSCTETGIERYTCVNSGCEYYIDETIPMDDHDYEEIASSGGYVTQKCKNCFKTITTPITYNIHYSLGGGSAVNENTYTIETDTFTLINPTKKGYEFTGWTGTGLSSVTKTVTIPKGSVGERSYTANWKVNTYTINYNLDGGVVDNPNIYTIENEFVLSNPEKIGYTFVGWTGTGLSNKTMLVAIKKGTIGTREYTANWEVNDYKIIYEDNLFYVDITIDENYDAGRVTTTRLYNGDNFEYPNIPTRTGYIFRGWFIDEACTTPYRFNQLICEDLYLYAGWYRMARYDYNPLFLNATKYTDSSTCYTTEMGESKVQYFYVIANESGEHNVDISDPYYGMGPQAQVYNLTTNKVIGEIVVGYYNKDLKAFNCEKGDIIAIKVVQGTYDSSWAFQDEVSIWFTNFTKTSTSTSVTRNTYFEGVISEFKVTYDAPFILQTPQRDGYVLDYWFDNEGNSYKNGIWNTPKDIVLTAKWMPNSYTVIYNSGLGVASKESQTVIMGQDTTLATATRVGYDFLGWYYNGVLVGDGEWTIADNVTLEAKWELKSETPYMIKHFRQNIENDDYTLYETDNLLGKINEVVTPAVNTYEGFTSPAAKTVTVLEDGSVVVEYKYTRNKYQLKYISNGGSINSTTTLKYGMSLSLEVPKKDNRAFGGWFTDIALTNSFTESTMPAQDITVYAWWQEETKASEFMYTGTETAMIYKYIGERTSIVIPSHIAGLSVTTISSEAFLNNITITSAIVPKTVTTIQPKAFSGCINLTNVVLPVSLTNIEEQAFFGCSSLTTVYYKGSATDWNNISIVSNFYLTNANRYYYSKEEPALNADGTAYDGNYWRYVAGVPNIWVYEE